MNLSLTDPKLIAGAVAVILIVAVLAWLYVRKRRSIVSEAAGHATVVPQRGPPAVERDRSGSRRGGGSVLYRHLLPGPPARPGTGSRLCAFRPCAHCGRRATERRGTSYAASGTRNTAGTVMRAELEPVRGTRFNLKGLSHSGRLSRRVQPWLSRSWW